MRDHAHSHTYHMMANYLAENINGKLVIGLRDVSHTMRALYEGKGSQARVLILLSEAGTITQRELTRRLGVQPGSASEVIAKLENAGLVARASSPADRRTADISLTELGKRQAGAAMEQRQRRHEEMFSALSDEEKLQLLRLLEKINGDWDERYRGGRDGRGRRHERGRGGFGHDRSHEHFADREHGTGHGCGHDCARCAHPCGRGRNR